MPPNDDNGSSNSFSHSHSRATATAKNSHSRQQPRPLRRQPFHRQVFQNLNVERTFKSHLLSVMPFSLFSVKLTLTPAFRAMLTALLKTRLLKLRRRSSSSLSVLSKDGHTRNHKIRHDCEEYRIVMNLQNLGGNFSIDSGERPQLVHARLTLMQRF